MGEETRAAEEAGVVQDKPSGPLAPPHEVTYKPWEKRLQDFFEELEQIKIDWR